MLWLVPYIVSPLIASYCVRRWWYAIVVASILNVPIMWARLIWLESRLGKPPDYDVILAIAIGIWTLATIVFNCVVIVLVRGVTTLIRGSVGSELEE